MRRMLVSRSSLEKPRPLERLVRTSSPSSTSTGRPRPRTSASSMAASVLLPEPLRAVNPPTKPFAMGGAFSRQASQVARAFTLECVLQAFAAPLADLRQAEACESHALGAACATLPVLATLPPTRMLCPIPSAVRVTLGVPAGFAHALAHGFAQTGAWTTGRPPECGDPGGRGA